MGLGTGGSGFSLRASLKQWAKGWLSGGPHLTIGPRYLLRWYVIPRNPWLNVYLHQFLHDDEDRALHDHPWWFVSVMAWGRYREMIESGLVERAAPSLAYRPAMHAHRVVLKRDYKDRPIPCWTLVITGRVTRDWGFYCPQGWKHWKEFTAYNNGQGDYGQVGRGCD
jgi:hypothetical protein